MKWISVKDGLPSKNQVVLTIYDATEWVAEGGFKHKLLAYVDLCDDGKYYFMDESRATSYSPTHWMPLPPKPKKKKMTKSKKKPLLLVITHKLDIAPYVEACMKRLFSIANELGLQGDKVSDLIYTGTNKEDPLSVASSFHWLIEVDDE